MPRSPGCQHHRRSGCGRPPGGSPAATGSNPPPWPPTGETLDALWGHLGEIPVDAITADQIEEFLQARWATAAPAAFNRHRAGLFALDGVPA